MWCKVAPTNMSKGKDVPNLSLNIKLKRHKIGDCSHVNDSGVLVSFPGVPPNFPIIYF